MESVAKGSTSAFCSAPTFSSPCVYAPVHAATAPSRIPVSFRLRNSSKEYNSAFRRSRSKLTPSHSNDLPSNTAPNSLNAYGDTTPQQHLKQELELDSSGGNGVAPPRNGGGSGNGRWHAGESGSEGEGEGVGLDPEVLAILAAAGRDVSSLPPDVRSATASQMHRLLAVERTPLIGWLASAWPALRNRLVANERLPVQLGVELCVGFITKTLAEVQGRGKKFWKEFDFYLSDMALELVGDAMLVWLLSPVALFSGGIESKGIGAFLQKLPKHAGQIGAFSPLQRASAFSFKAVQFGLVGFFSSMLGHGLTTFLVNQRHAAALRRGEAEESDVKLAAVVPTSAVWGLFMLLSSNSRYQFVNALEQRAIDPLFGRSALVLTVVTFMVRFGNCFVGGVQWLPFAQRFGIQ